MADAQDTKTLRGYDAARLSDELVSLKKEQFNLRFQQATGQLEKSSRIREVRRAITREMKRQGRVWIRIFPDVPVSKKPNEVRMGSGKGAPEFWAARVAPGRIMFEIDGVPEAVARESLRLGAAKLPIRTKIVSRVEGL